MSRNKAKVIDPKYYRDNLEKLTEILGVEKDYWQCFLESITHSTFIEEKKPSWKCNERIEFLGDSVIDLTISDFLYREFPEEDEGELTIQRANLVSTESFADLSRKLGFGKFLLLGKGEESSGGADKNSVLADLYESIIGMVFLCKGFEFTSKLILSHFEEKLRDISIIKKPAKSLLQEVSQKTLKKSPVYHIINETGKLHKNFL
ncbi:ribonuclease III, partial [bacterium]|nr:ribonuclease III [bacterium]